MTSSMIATAAAATGAPLGAVLRHARIKAKFSTKEAAARLNCSRTKISRIENHHVRSINPRDAYDLLRLYGWAPEPAALAAGYDLHPDPELLDIFDPAITPMMRPYLEYESRAASIESFHTEVLPGLVQTQAYTAALAQMMVERQLDLGIDPALQYRRQQRFFHSAPPIQIVMSEATLRRGFLSGMHAREQMAKILEVAAHPQVTLRVLPLTADVVPGSERTFSIFEMPPSEPSARVACVHTLRATTYFVDTEEYHRYRRIFAEVSHAALSPAESAALVRQMGARLPAPR